MVVGDGMLAKAFEMFKDDPHVIIFASGVSNSKEVRVEEFNREINLLLSMDKNKLLVYFSTCSVFDPTVQNTHYVRHKMEMETLINANFRSNLIFRLPTVVGHTGNSHTFFNFFKNAILSGDVLNIDIDASRHLIDIDDLKKLLPDIILKQKEFPSDYKKTINVGFDNGELVTSIVAKMCFIMGREFSCNYTYNGCSYDFDKSYFRDYLQRRGYYIQETYNEKLLQKYLNEHI